jgi:tRNA threonylcarbamoyladenosine biosynthesis protein TsaB
VKVLAVETSTAVCGAAVVSGDEVLTERSLYEKHVHSEKLVTMIDALIAETDDYDAVAVSIGPGSFTGLRIGLSVAKGLTYAHDKPLVSVPTLEALAWRAVLEDGVRDGDEILAMIDARRNDVYAAAFTVAKNELVSNWGPEALSLDALMERFPRQNRIVLMGDAVDKLVRRFEDRLRGNGRFLIPPLLERLCSASAVGLVGVRKALRGDFAERSSLEPLYVKDFVSLVQKQHITS